MKRVSSPTFSFITWSWSPVAVSMNTRLSPSSQE